MPIPTPGVLPSGAPPSQHHHDAQRPSRNYGHRVLIASLFLPDTITFHERDESVVATPQDQSSAPASPSADDVGEHDSSNNDYVSSQRLSVHELGKRLAGVSAAFKTTAAEEVANQSPDGAVKGEQAQAARSSSDGAGRDATNDSPLAPPHGR